MEKKYNVGYISNKYPEKRYIIDKCSRINYCFFNRNKSLIYLLNRCLVKLKLLNKWDSVAKYKINKKNIKIFNTINTVLETKNDWCVIFESTVPRNSNTVDRLWEKDDRFKVSFQTKSQIKLLEKNNCKAIIAMSNNALKIQYNMLNRLEISDEKKERIMKKTIVLLPPQEVLIKVEDIEKRYTDCKKIKFAFIGRDFFRKGGAQIIDVMQKLKNVYDFQLVIISSLDYGDYASHSDYQDYIKYKKIIEESSWIEYYESLPNEKVIDILKECHVGLLPTFADTFGFSVLEMQATGLPVITTDIRALTEINDDYYGYIINLNKNKYGEALLGDDYNLNKNKKMLEKGLENSIIKVLDDFNKNILQYKAKECVKRINEKHNPELYAQQIYKIYCDK